MWKNLEKVGKCAKMWKNPEKVGKCAKLWKNPDRPSPIGSAAKMILISFPLETYGSGEWVPQYFESDEWFGTLPLSGIHERRRP